MENKIKWLEEILEKKQKYIKEKLEFWERMLN